MSDAAGDKVVVEPRKLWASHGKVATRTLQLGREGSIFGSYRPLTCLMGWCASNISFREATFCVCVCVCVCVTTHCLDNNNFSPKLVVKYF